MTHNWPETKRFFFYCIRCIAAAIKKIYQSVQSLYLLADDKSKPRLGDGGTFNIVGSLNSLATTLKKQDITSECVQNNVEFSHIYVMCSSVSLKLLLIRGRGFVSCFPTHIFCVMLKLMLRKTTVWLITSDQWSAKIIRSNIPKHTSLRNFFHIYLILCIYRHLFFMII